MRLREIPNEVARSCASAGRAVTYSPRLECHADPLTATCEDATVTEPESTSTAPKLAVPRLLNGQKAIVTGANSLSPESWYPKGPQLSGIARAETQDRASAAARDPVLARDSG